MFTFRKHRQSSSRNDARHGNFFSLHLAFTLAEVLIVLGIIGIVAEMTIPTLTSSTQDAEFKAALKKNFSVLSQAQLLLATENDGEFVSSLSACSAGQHACLKNVFKSKLKYVKECDSNSTNLGDCFVDQANAKYLNGGAASSYYFNGNSPSGLVLNDGASLAFSFDSTTCTALQSPDYTNRCAFIALDVNGPKKPNTWGKDIYVFFLFVDTIRPGGVGVVDTMVAAADDCKTGTNNGFTCASKYMYGK